MTETTSTSDPRPSFGGEVRPPLPARNWGWTMFRGLLALGLGLLAILYPFSAITAFAMLFAIFALVDGLAMLVTGIVGAARHEERWAAFIIAGIIGIVVGILYFAWPGLSTLTYAFLLLVLIAGWAIINGVAQISAAIRLRRDMEGEWLLGLAGFFSILLGVAILLVIVLVPGASILSVGWIIGFYALIAGAALVALAFRLRARSAPSG